MGNVSERSAGWYPAPDGRSEIYWTGDAWSDVRAKPQQRPTGWYPAPDGVSEIYWTGDAWGEVRAISTPAPRGVVQTTAPPDPGLPPTQSAEPTPPSSQQARTQQTWTPGDVANGHVVTAEGRWMSVHAHADDAAALEAYRQQALRYRDSITGWKPLVFWYGFWMIAFGIGAISALLSGEVGVFLVGVVMTGLLFLYARYLFRGGTRRFWFVIF